MKKILLSLFGFCISAIVYCQHVGIGTTTAPELLTVNGTALIDASNLNNGFFPNGKVLKFGTVGGVGIGSNKIAGPSTNGLEFFTGFSRRFVIDSAGFIGINADAIPPFRLAVNGNSFMGGLALGTTTSDLSFYKLDVEGNTRVRNDSYINRDLWVDRNLDVDGTAIITGNITAETNLSIGGNITAVDNISVSQNITVTGNITVDGGKGVIRSTNSTQQVIAFTSGTVTIPNSAAGAFYDAQFSIPANKFSANPFISIAQLTNHSGSFERWTHSIVNVDYLNNSFWVRFHNSSSQSSTAAYTLHFILVGPAL